MGMYDALGIAPELLAYVEYTPLEDWIIRVLRPVLTPHGISVQPQIPDEPELPLVLPRRMASFGSYDGDPRGLLDRYRFAVHVYVDNPNADQKAAVYSEIVRSILIKAGQSGWYDPELGAITKITMTEAPARSSDWATSQGPVQYADLPVGVQRYETHYHLTARPPSTQ